MIKTIFQPLHKKKVLVWVDNINYRLSKFQTYFNGIQKKLLFVYVPS
jgi:hypothetical protein